VNYTLSALQSPDRGKQKQILLLNLDETNIVYNYARLQKGMVVRKVNPADRKGSLLAAKRKSRKSKAVQRFLPQQDRGSVTLCSLICNDTSIQPALPQVILGNERKFSPLLLAEVAAEGIPQNVHLWRAKSAWMSGQKMKEFIALLVKSLAKYLDTHEIVLALDCASCHLEASVLKYARRMHVHLLFVPADTTGVIQPLDVCGFKWLKGLLRNKWQAFRMEMDQGIMTDKQWLKAIIEVADAMRSKKWNDAFVSNGFIVGQAGIRSAILEKLELSRLRVPQGCPQEDWLRFLLPANRQHVQVSHLLNLVGPRPSKTPAVSLSQLAASARSLEPIQTFSLTCLIVVGYNT